MSKFYTNVNMFGNKLLVRGHDSGKRYQKAVKYKPTHYIISDTAGVKTNFKTLDNKKVSKIQFESIKEAKKFIDDYKDVSNFNIYGLEKYAYTYIFENFEENFDYHLDQINIGTIDIETDSSSGFPEADDADKQIISIALRKKDQTFVLGYFPYISKNKNVIYIQCKNEEELLLKFLEIWTYLDLDIITGWHIVAYDIPYIVNRIRRILGEDYVKKLSPWGMVHAIVTRDDRGNEINSYRIIGIENLDYELAYKKFTYVKQESYALDFIGFVELGEKKVDYHSVGYETLNQLYTQNFELFIDYNIQDVDLVYKLNEKLGLIEQIITLAYMARVNFTDAFTSVLIWDVIIHNYLMNDKTVIITNTKREKKLQKIMGAYVKSPLVGSHDWVVSFDLNSLYPHLIMQYNISPETIDHYDYTFKDTFSVEDLIEKAHLNNATVINNFNKNLTVTPNGVYFKKNTRGFLPKLMELLYTNRDSIKKKMIALKKENQLEPSKEKQNEISKSNNMQMALKILLNSAYGALTNEWFRYFSINLGEAITYSGQLSIKWIAEYMNKYLNNILKTDNVDYIIASDTDSLYVQFGPFVEKFKLNNLEPIEISRKIDLACKEKIEPYMNKVYQDLASLMNAYDQKMFMKRENIASRGIWLAKKKYILNVWNEEGVEYSKPKLKLTGVEAIRSSTPYYLRENIKKCIGIIMNENNDALITFIDDFREHYKTLQFAQIASPSSVNNMVKYTNKSTGLYEPKTPIYVRGSILYNFMLNKTNTQNKYHKIKDGDKVKWAYLKVPNPIHENVIASPGALPEEFKLQNYVDYDLMFENTFINPIKHITKVINWDVEKTNNLMDFFQ